MKFLANENFPLDSIKYLTLIGIDIIGIGVDNLGIEDHEVIELAEKEGRTILTFDRDYGTLIFKYGYRPSGGVIYFRLEKYDSEEPGRLTEALIKLEDFSPESSLVVFDGKTIRQKRF